MNHSRSLAVLLSFSALTAVASAQVAPGHRIYAPHFTTETYMIDNAGEIVHTWPGGYPPGNGVYLEEDGTLIRCGQVAGNPGPGGSGGAVQRIAFDGTVEWDFQYTGPDFWHHHDIEPLPNGNVLMIAWDILTTGDAIAAGRNPALLAGTRWMPDTIVEVQQTGPTTGQVVWKWSVMDHLIQDFDPLQANFGVVADHPELLDVNFPAEVVANGDWNHANAIDYDPINDLILLNFPFQDEFYIIDHSTTTAEAAGHTGGNFGKGGDFLYRWGRPESYDAGTSGDQKLFNQHGTAFIPEGLPGAGNLIGFNNQAGTPLGQNFSAVYELELPATFDLAPGAAWGPTDFAWEYTAPVPTDFYSSGLSNAERLPNGNTLVASGRQGWIFEITDAGNLVWEYFNQLPNPTALIFQVSYYERYLWSSTETVSATTGGTVDFDLVSGTPLAGDFYFLLGSGSGTSPGLSGGGLTLPLNFDPYFLFTLENPNSVLLPGSLGLLDPLGRAAASFVLPPDPSLAGIELHHAYVVLDAGNLSPKQVSNPVRLETTS